MKTVRLVLSLIVVASLSVRVYAPSFAVLLGSGEKDPAAADSKDWITVESIAWAKGAAKEGASTSVAAPHAAGSAGGARRAFEPVVLTIPVEGRGAKANKAFKKGGKLGTIRLRDGDRTIVLHDVVVADVKRKGPSEEISLNYAKIENATVPERAKARMEAGTPGRAP